MKIFRILFFAIFFLGGCSALQNLTVEDVRQPKYLAVTKTFNLTLPQISKNLYEYDTRCSPLLINLRISPSNPDIGIISVTSMGLTQASVVAVIDFKQDGKQTLVRGYKYTTPLISNLERIIWAIDHPNECYRVTPVNQSGSNEKD
jgi:hypothetical protein